MQKILIIEDDQNLGLSLQEYLSKEGYQVNLVNSLSAGEEALAPLPDLILLDWMLPDGQGLDFLVTLRKRGCLCPIILLTARTDLVDRVLGLEVGANDYITKPFEPRELLARVRVQLRSPHSTEGSGLNKKIKVGSLQVDATSYEVYFSEKKIECTKKEFELLLLLAEAPEKLFSREEILNKVWGYEVYPTTRTVDNHIMILRQKTDECLIETVRGVGYRLKII